MHPFAEEMTLPEQSRAWDNIALRGLRYPHAPDLELIERIENIAPKLRQALDIGCGWGRHLGYLVNRGWRATGMDLSQDALNNARRELNRESLTASLVKADYRNLPFQQGQFHLIIATNVLNHGKLADMRRALLEIRRMLAIGGTAVVSVPSLRAAPLQVGGNWIEPGTLVLGDSAERGIPHHFFTLEELTELTKVYREADIKAVLRPFPRGYVPLHLQQQNEWFWIVLTG